MANAWDELMEKSKGVSCAIGQTVKVTFHDQQTGKVAARRDCKVTSASYADIDGLLIAKAQIADHIQGEITWNGTEWVNSPCHEY